MRALTCLAMMSVTWSASYSATLESPYHSSDPRAASAKRQTVDCMNKHMAASRTLSYNEASRICRDQVKDQLLALQAPVAASGTPQKAVSAP